MGEKYADLHLEEGDRGRRRTPRGRCEGQNEDQAMGQAEGWGVGHEQLENKGEGLGETRVEKGGRQGEEQPVGQGDALDHSLWWRMMQDEAYETCEASFGIKTDHEKETQMTVWEGCGEGG